LNFVAESLSLKTFCGKQSVVLVNNSGTVSVKRFSILTVIVVDHWW